ncbi:ABC transporter ATP-binding protein [Paracoccus sphaerophysae]|uniref:ABC transporter ATP-binding protein n=1 Tax=Paracoccus sphaerophysae TaxID=690417 RepID=UPI002353B406|nr:ABC transporter ATP-binding protein [Paracoccus sphaerophysae]
MAELLRVTALSAGYGDLRVIRDLSLSLARAEALAVLGRNGVGKTTLVESLVGLTRRFAGTVALDGRDVSALPPEARVRAGIGWVPQSRGIFRSLTVRQNLTATARPGPWTLDRVHEMFPRLAERGGHMGDQLSGGEQQMLAIGRALMLNPSVLLLDEPTEGLAPVIVDRLFAALGQLRQEGMALIVVEQHARGVLDLTDRAVILDRGRIVHEAPSAELRHDTAALDAHLGVPSAALPRGAAAP